MSNISRRKLMTTVAVLAGAAAVGLGGAARAQDRTGFQAAAAGMPDGPMDRGPRTPGLQNVYAICEVTGGGTKVYGVAVEYDVAIDAASLSPATFTAAVFPAARGYMPGLPEAADKNATQAPAAPRGIVSFYTNDYPVLRPDRRSVSGRFVILEFAHDADLSTPTTDSDRVALTQNKPVRTLSGASYAGGGTIRTNAGRRGTNTSIRGVDAWELNHWYWDDKVAATLEYSIFLPKSFFANGGEKKRYPLVLAVTHSGTSYDGTCLETLTEQPIATIWSLPENQAKHECVVVTPRYERTTMNDYWEHTADVENTHRLVEYLLSDRWNYGNPNLDDRRDKVLLIDPKRVYATGWSMGAMTSLWLMAKHPDTYAAGLIIAGQQRPGDVVNLAKQKLLIITGSEDDKATPWNERCVPVWERAGAKVTRPAARLDPNLIFPIDRQQALTSQVDGYLAQGGNITFLTFQGVDHMGSARKFFYINAARNWLLSQAKT